MADPTKYTHSYSYSGYEASQPARPKPGSELDNDFGRVQISIGEIVDAVMEIRRSDGALQNGIVTVESLAPGLGDDLVGGAVDDAAASAAAAAVSASSASSSQASATSSASAAAASAAAALAAQNSLLVWRGAWATTTAYTPSSIVFQSGSSYVCVVAHTAGVFATDLGAGRWALFAQQGATGAGTGDMVAANNLSDLTNANTARTNMGVAIGSQVQGYSAKLAALAALTVAADKLIYATGASTFAATDLTAAARALLDDADAAAQRTTLGLGALATKATADTADLTDGAVTLAKIAASAIITAAETIAANNNDTTVPTSAAVKAYVDGAGGSLAAAFAGDVGSPRIQAGAFPDFAVGAVEIINFMMPANAVQAITRAGSNSQNEVGLITPYTCLKGGTLRLSVDMRKWGAYTGGSDGLLIKKNGTTIATVNAIASWATYTSDFTFAAGDEIAFLGTVTSTTTQGGRTEFRNLRLLGDQRGLFRL